MLNSHLKMLKQQHFLYQRKNLYDLMPSRSFSGEPISDDNYRFLSLLEFFFVFLAPYFILVSVALAGEILQLIGRWNIFYFYHILSAAARLWVWYPP